MAGRERAASEGRRAAAARKAWRVATWLALTGVAVAAAVLSVYTESGVHRLARAGVPPGAGAATARPAPDPEMRRLAETVRALTADRDRLAERVAALERNLDDVTGSVPNHAVGERFPAAVPPSAAAPAPGASTPAADPKPPSPVSSTTPPDLLSPATVLPTLPLGPAGSAVTRTEFGVDLGSAPTVDGLRNLWLSVKNGHGPLVEGLRPVVAVRDGAKPGTVELRLVAGPVANASVAARLCAALAVAGITCQAAVFDGQRLALK
jgi:hypothetical protein